MRKTAISLALCALTGLASAALGGDDNCARRSAYTRPYDGHFELGTSVSAATVPGLQKKINQAYQRIFGTDLGHEIARSVFLCSPEILKWHTGMSLGAAEGIVSDACPRRSILERRPSEEDHLFALFRDYFRTAEGKKTGRELLSCDAFEFRLWLGFSEKQAQQLSAECRTDQDTTCPPGDSLTEGVFPVLAAIQPPLYRAEGEPMGRCIVLMPGFDKYPDNVLDIHGLDQSFTEDETNRTEIYTDTQGHFPEANLDRILQHELYVSLDAKQKFHYPEFFMANGLRPDSIQPSADLLSRIIADHATNAAFTADRAFTFEQVAGMSETDREQAIKEIVGSPADRNRLNHECIAWLKAKRAVYFTGMTPGMYAHSTQFLYNSDDNKYDSHQMRVEGYRPDFDPLAALEKTTIHIGSDKIPACLWLRQPAVSGFNSRLDLGGPRPCTNC